MIKKPRSRTLNEVREVGMAALREALGPVDAIRFLQMFDLGSGDYTAERDEILGDPSLDELSRQLREMREQKTAAK
ncbi:MAG TPA: hypothetical protein VK689_10395 [Armatimonadota bacterium]|nr:hypothetical protein [Armatimonadota bacterium]